MEPLIPSPAVGFGQSPEQVKIFHEIQLEHTINFRKDLDAMIIDMGALEKNREVSIVLTKLQEARMWLGQNCANHGSDYGDSQYAHKAEK